MKVLDDIDEDFRIIVVMRPESTLIRRGLNDSGAELIIVLQWSNCDFEQNSSVHCLLRSAESYSERLKFQIFSFGGPKLWILLLDINFAFGYSVYILLLNDIIKVF